MADAALTPTGFVKETLDKTRSGLIPAIVGVTGAGLGLLALTPFMAPASLPMSLLGMVLGRRGRNRPAVALGALGMVAALSVLPRSPELWVVFATAVSNMRPI